MRALTLGVIAITSLMAFACTTTTETTTTETRGAEPANADEGGFRSRLVLSRPHNAAAIAALAGKRGNVGGPLAPFGGGAGGACGLSSGDNTCDACLDKGCCAENKACVADADCNALVACGNACTDDACIAKCLSDHPTGAKKLETLATCAQTSCTAACGGSPSGSSCGFAGGSTACDACLDKSCCGAANACLGDADCTALIDCASACGDAKCHATCEAAHPTGAAKIAAVTTCASTSCGGICNAPPSSPNPPAGSCGLTSGDATCDACLDGKCCAQTSACIGDADCTALVVCQSGCSDATCAAACDAAHPTGAAKLASVFSCVTTSCKSACGL